jgi:uncharacterized protein (UPF0333 family)
MKAQVAVEYLVVVTLVLGTSIFLFYYTSTYSSESIAMKQTRESIQTVAKTIDYVYALGPGAKTTVIIDLPSSMIDSYVFQNEIGFKIGVSGHIADVYEITKTRVSGTLPKTPGRHVINVNSTEAGVFIG